MDPMRVFAGAILGSCIGGIGAWSLGRRPGMAVAAGALAGAAVGALTKPANTLAAGAPVAASGSAQLT